jgi:hypothetical protein
LTLDSPRKSIHWLHKKETNKNVMISPQDREICSVDFLSYGYSAMIGRVPLFYSKRRI